MKKGCILYFLFLGGLGVYGGITRGDGCLVGIAIIGTLIMLLMLGDLDGGGGKGIGGYIKGQ